MKLILVIYVSQIIIFMVEPNNYSIHDNFKGKKIKEAQQVS